MDDARVIFCVSGFDYLMVPGGNKRRLQTARIDLLLSAPLVSGRLRQLLKTLSSSLLLLLLLPGAMPRTFRFGIR